MKKLRGFVFNVLGSGVEIKLTKECIKDCYHPGACDEGVSRWVELLRPNLKELPPELIKKCLRPYGAWEDSELEDPEVNLDRFLWLAAGDCVENKTCWTYMEAY